MSSNLNFIFFNKLINELNQKKEKLETEKIKMNGEYIILKEKDNKTISELKNKNNSLKSDILKCKNEIEEIKKNKKIRELEKDKLIKELDEKNKNLNKNFEDISSSLNLN